MLFHGFPDHCVLRVVAEVVVSVSEGKSVLADADDVVPGVFLVSADVDAEEEVVMLSGAMCEQVFPGLDGVELTVNLGHGFFHGGEVGFALLFGDALQFSPAARAFERNLLRGADTGHYVFALCVNEPFAVEEVFARSGIAAEAYTGC